MFCHLLVGAALSLAQAGGSSPTVGDPGGLPSSPGTSALQAASPGQASPPAGQVSFPDYYWGAGETAGAKSPGAAKETEQPGTQRGQGPPAKPEEPAPTEQGPKRRAMPSPWESPPFPGSEYQGYPLIGVPIDTTYWPLQKTLQGTYPGDLLQAARIRLYGWVTVEGNVSNDKFSNSPDSYWIRPNKFDMDQAIIRLERQPDTVQTDHIDWGFRSTALYGIDYRYMTAGGWTSDQLLEHNRLYGFDATEQYLDVYVPWVAQGMIVRVGRWIACPDIETQFAPDNYMGSHSILFTFDTYTQTGVMFTFKLSDQWMFQAAVHSGTDMAPWYRGALWTGAFGIRWVSKSNNDAFYGWLNAINSSNFRRFDEDGQPAGHDNFNYWVQTWEHRFNPLVVTKTEGYIMWQRNAVLGGTPSIGPVQTFGGGGGIGPDIPGTSLTYGLLNYTMFQTSKKGFITVRNEWWRDVQGERSGFPGTYSSHTIGFTHNFTPLLQVRPEVGYYRNWTEPAFDLGAKKGAVIAGFDMTLRF
jgi:hypothetical protein